jgi:PAS domain S-box-containing protein
MLGVCSHNDLRTFVESIPDCAFVVAITADGRFFYETINQLHADRLGLRIHQVAGRSPHELMEESAAEAVTAQYRACLESGERLEYEQQMTVGGRTSWWRTSVAPLRGSNGTIRRLLGISIDVTETRASRSALEASEGRFRTILENASTGIVIADGATARILLANPAAEVLFAADEGGLVGRSYFDLLDSAARANTAAVHEAHLGGSVAVFRGERLFQRLDGTRFWGEVNGAPALDPSNGRRLWIAVLQDQTAVRRAEQRLLDAIDSMDDGFGLFGADERLLVCNAPYAELFDAAPDSLTGARYQTLLRRAATKRVATGRLRADQVEAYVAQGMANFRLADGHPIEFQTPDGRWMIMRQRRTQEGGTVVSRTDISESKRLAQDLEQAHRVAERARALAEQASRAKSDFLATMSHELRTPLNAIIGFGEIMQQQMFGPLGDPHYEDYIDDVLASARHLLDLINELLDLAKIEAGKMVLDETPLDLAQVMRASVRLLQTRAARKDLTLAADHARAPQLLADERALKQMLLNLLSNAIKFTREGGRIALGCDVDDEWITISVVDDGIGIPEHELPGILDPFTQASNAWATGEVGTGLGLSIVKGLAELHGGSFVIESRNGTGTAARILLPARRLVAPV